MSKKGKNKTTHREAQHESTQQGKSDRRWVTPIIWSSFLATVFVLTGLFGHWHDGLVEYVLAPVFILVCGYSVYELSRWARVGKTKSGIVAAFSILILSCSIYGIYAGFPDPSQRTFRITAGVASLNPLADRVNGFCFLYGLHDNPTISPISAAIFIEFTNLSSADYMIDSYSVETQQDDGIWKPLHSVVFPKYLYFGDDLHHMKKVDLGGKAFDSEVNDKNLAPGETVKGWIFLNVPPGMPTTNLRFRAEDMSAQQYVQPIKVPSGSADLAVSSQWVKFYLGREEDISNHPVSIWLGDPTMLYLDSPVPSSQ